MVVEAGMVLVVLVMDVVMVLIVEAGILIVDTVPMKDSLTSKMGQETSVPPAQFFTVEIKNFHA